MVPLGLCKTCKRAVSQEAKSCPACGQPEPYQPVPDDVRLLMGRGQKIQAIKQIQEVTGMGLKEAKEFVESLERQEKEIRGFKT